VSVTRIGGEFRRFAATASEVKALNDLAKNVVLWIVIAVVLATVVSNFSSRTAATQEMPYSAFLAHVKDGTVSQSPSAGQDHRRAVDRRAVRGLQPGNR